MTESTFEIIENKEVVIEKNSDDETIYCLDDVLNALKLHFEESMMKKIIINKLGRQSITHINDIVYINENALAFMLVISETTTGVGLTKLIFNKLFPEYKDEVVNKNKDNKYNSKLDNVFEQMLRENHLIK